MQPLEGFYYFTQVVEHGGFARAARALGIPKSRISRHVVALEAQLNVRLINRSTRRFAVTEVGQEVYLHATAMLAEATQHWKRWSSRAPSPAARSAQAARWR